MRRDTVSPLNLLWFGVSRSDSASGVRKFMFAVSLVVLVDLGSFRQTLFVNCKLRKNIFLNLFNRVPKTMTTPEESRRAGMTRRIIGHRLLACGAWSTECTAVRGHALLRPSGPDPVSL